MSRVTLYRRVLEDDLPMYLAEGWIEVDRTAFGLGTHDVLIEKAEQDNQQDGGQDMTP